MNKFMIFLAGAGVGAGISYFVVKKSMEEKNAKEIEYVRSEFEKMLEAERNIHADNPADAKDTVEKIAKENGYSESSASSEKTEETSTTDSKDKETKQDENEPHIIKPEEFGSGSYEVETLVYYAKNEKLVVAGGGEVEVIDDLFPSEFLNRFGEYEEDMLYVRDPKEGIDYDIEYVDEAYKRK